MKKQATLHGAKPWRLCSAHHAGATLRYTTTKRLYVRTDITFATHINIAPERLYKSIYKLRRAFNNRFPQLLNVNFEYVYGALFHYQEAPYLSLPMQVRMFTLELQVTVQE